MWTTLLETKEQKDRSRRLMRVATCLQGYFVSTAHKVETYKLVCWKSSSIVAFDDRVVQLRDTTLAVYERGAAPQRPLRREREA